jgi:hypothetical protein
MTDAPQQKIVWAPLPGSQALALACPCNIILYEGTRGPGKTDAQLMAFRKLVGQGYGAFWRGVIFDREYKQLDDLVAKSKKWFSQFGDGAKFLESTKDYKWVWPTGEELLFRSIMDEKGYWNYHGQEFPFIGWNELSKYPTDKTFESMMSCNRSSFLPAEHSPDLNKPLPEMPLVVFATTNPYGPGHNWVKRRFIDAARPGQVIKTTTNVFNPRTKEREDIVKTQVRIFGSYKENRYLSPIYIATLESVKEKNKRRAWLWGDWDIVAGGALDDVWIEGVHVIKRFQIPHTWRLDRSFDWGSDKPFSVGWWAEANGEEAELSNGTKFCPPRGTLIRINEWYGSPEVGTNTGLHLGSAAVARGIKEIEQQMRFEGWINGNAIQPGPADNSISSVQDEDSDSVAIKMAKEGVKWIDSDKSPGSRKVGLQLLRDRLEASVKGEGPGIYFMEHCNATIATLPVLPRDPKKTEDVDTSAEDHIYDEIRYRVLCNAKKFATNVQTSFSR